MPKQEDEKKELTPLDAISPLDGRYWNKVENLSPHASEAALIKTRIEVEAKYLIALSEAGLVRPLTVEEELRLVLLGNNLTQEQTERVKEIEDTTRHDVKAMERAMREFFLGTSLEDVLEMVHFGLTSEDINNISYRLMLERAKKEVCIPALDEVVDAFASMAEKYRDVPMLARTHGQPAVPTTLGKEMANFAIRLNTQVRKLEGTRLTGKLNGAVGNYNALVFAAPEIDWIAFSEKFVKKLGLESSLITTQINFADDMIEMFQVFERINYVLINIDADMWRYISDDWFIQEVKKGEVGSSTMPQKVNPIDFENSKGNAEVSNGMLEGLSRQLAVSWLQRDLSGSTASRNVGVGLGHGLLAYQSLLTGLKRVRPNEEVIHEELHRNWAILSEGVQTLLRRLGEKDPYSMVADLTRGQKIDAEAWHKWVVGLNQSPDVIETLLKLSPDTYIGNAPELVDLALRQIGESRK